MVVSRAAYPVFGGRTVWRAGRAVGGSPHEDGYPVGEHGKRLLGKMAGPGKAV